MKKRSISVAIVAACLILGILMLTSCGSYEPMRYDPEQDYGLYWYGEDGEIADAVRMSDSISTAYFDPAKPTVLYFHGWKPEAANDKVTKLEDIRTPAVRQDEIQAFDPVAYYKEAGYNVGAMAWYQGAASLEKLFGYIWTDLEWNGASQETSLAFAFASEIASVFGDSYEKPITFIGHSYGTQAAVATNYLLAKYVDKGLLSNPNLIAERMSLADPYIGDLAIPSKEVLQQKIYGTQEKIDGRLSAELFADCLEYLNTEHGVTAELYCGMPLAYDQYASKDKALRQAISEKLKQNSAWFVMQALQDTYGSVGDIHNITRDYMLLSLQKQVYTQDGAPAPGLSTPTAQLRECVGKSFVLQECDMWDVSSSAMIVRK